MMNRHEALLLIERLKSRTRDPDVCRACGDDRALAGNLRAAEMGVQRNRKAAASLPADPASVRTAPHAGR